jgi:hypothetical protein
MGRPVRQVLREAQVDAVVNRHDIGTARERRDDVVRCVKQIDAGPHQVEWDRELFGDRVVAGALDEDLEVRAERPGKRDIVEAADEDVLVAPALPRQLAHQVADVRPDPVVVQLANVNCDAHRGFPHRLY